MSCEHRQLVIMGLDRANIKCGACGKEWYYCLDGWAHYQLKEVPPVKTRPSAQTELDKAHHLLCMDAAKRAGLNEADAEECESGSLECTTCPWPRQPRGK